MTYGHASSPKGGAKGAAKYAQRSEINWYGGWRGLLRPERCGHRSLRGRVV